MESGKYAPKPTNHPRGRLSPGSQQTTPEVVCSSRERMERNASREMNKAFFEDTVRHCREDSTLAASIEASVRQQMAILEGRSLVSFGNGMDKDSSIKLHRFEEPACVTVSMKRTFEAARAYTDEGMKTVVLNFASATKPGGGVEKGSVAQEEALCKCSTLYFCINTRRMWDEFYQPHRNAYNYLHNDDCIYTPNVTVFKSDTATPSMLPQDEWYQVNVITCAAPKLWQYTHHSDKPGEGYATVEVTDEELRKIHVKRLRRILDIAAANGDEAVILGAFGCGAFHNNPDVVASAASEVIEDYLHAFRAIEFAIYSSPRRQHNYLTFEQMLHKYTKSHREDSN